MNGKEEIMETNWQGAPQGGPAIGAGGRAELAFDPQAAGKGREFKAFGKDGFTFFDFLDIINPLQHIPFVSTLYRNLTGDEIDPGARIAGATLFGGPVGLAVSALDTMIEHGTGKDVGDHVLAFLQEGSQPETPGKDQPNPVQVALAGPADYAAMDQKARPSPAAPAVSNAAGMTGIPIAKETFLSPNYTRRAAPDLQLLNEVKAQPQAKPAAASVPSAESLAQFETAAGAKPVKTAKPAQAPRTAPRPVAAPASLVPEGGNSWVYEAMLQAMDKYENTSRLTKLAPEAEISVTR